MTGIISKEQVLAMNENDAIEAMNENDAIEAMNENDAIEAMAKLSKKLKTLPQYTEKGTRFQNNADYIPIDQIQAMLDEDFDMQYKFTDYEFKVHWESKYEEETIDYRTKKPKKVMKVCWEAQIMFHYIHPVYKVWMSFPGCDSGTCTFANWPTIKQKAKMSCVTNAVKMLGERYGRSLNREKLEVATTIRTDEEIKKEMIEFDVTQKNAQQELKAIFEEIPEKLKKRYLGKYNAKLAEIKAAQSQAA